MKQAIIFSLVFGMVSMSSHALQETQTGEVYVNQADHILNDFAGQIESVLQQLSTHTNRLEETRTAFVDCDTKLGSTDLDQANYAKCTTQAAAKIRSAYYEYQKTMLKVINSTEKYRNQLESDNTADKEVLKVVTQRTESFNQTLSELTEELDRTIRKLEEIPEDVEITLDQEYAIIELIRHIEDAENMAYYDLWESDAVTGMMAVRNGVIPYLDRMIFNANNESLSAESTVTQISRYIEVVTLYGIQSAGAIKMNKTMDVLVGLDGLFDETIQSHKLFGNSMKGFKSIKVAVPDIKGKSRSNLLEMLKGMQSKYTATKEKTG